MQAHILVCFLAYVVWKTIGQMCNKAGLGDEPRRVFVEISKINTVDVVLPTRMGTEIRRRCVAQPTKYQSILLDRLGLHLPKQLDYQKCSVNFEPEKNYSRFITAELGLDLYSHVAPGLQQAAAKKFDELLIPRQENETVGENG